MTLEEIKARVAKIEKEAEAFATTGVEAGEPAISAYIAKKAYQQIALRAFLPELLREIEQRDQEIARLEKRLKAEPVEGGGDVAAGES